MKFTYETKYEAGDKVYQVMRYINGTHIIEREAVGVV